MPPHCDSLDGPVVTAARHALDAADVGLVLPFVPADGEDEVRAVFDRVLPIRGVAPEVGEIADRLFFETVVRIHRAGEGAPFTGLRPAGLDVGPAIPLAERAVLDGSPAPLADELTERLRSEVGRRLEHVRSLASARTGSIDEERAYVEAMLGFEVWAHHVYLAMTAPTDAHHHGAAHVD